ncbi:hypothetical protein ACFQZJ_05315 [Maribacter chungangensis]|uniref:Uncharacterized protein n=1 Tax=Maribacter chungangensis TaxID=1069117 RepID=A0ABW3B0Y4_9FLAO
MKIEILNTEVQLENDSVLLLPFEYPRNVELKDIIFEKEIWSYMGTNMNAESDFEIMY